MKSAVLIAAGEGVRAWPYCGIRQKTTVPIANVPLVRRLALDLIAVGIEELVVVVGHRGEAVRACLGDLTPVRFVEQPQRKGPADAALHGLAEIQNEEVLVCHGDIVTTRDSLRDFIESSRKRKAEAALLTAPRPKGLTASWMGVETTPDGLLRGVWGHGKGEGLRFAGVAAAKTDALRRCLERNPGIIDQTGVGAMPPLEGDIAISMDLMRQEGIEVHALPVKDFVVDVDKPWHIVEANVKAARHALDAMDRTEIAAGATIDEGAEIAPNTKVRLGPGAHIGKGCRIGGPVILGAGAQIVHGAIVEGHAILGAHARCEDYCKLGEGSVLGEHSVVGHGAEFEGVTFDVVFLYHYSCVTGLIGTHVDIGAATVCGTWRFDDGVRPQSVRGREEIPECFGEYTYIGDYSRTGVNAMFMPGVKVGYYVCVGPGAIVYDDVPERTMLLARQEHLTKPWGPEKYGW